MGSQALIEADTGLLLTMALHELATNAVKYGALSNGKGTVHIAWSAAQARGSVIMLRWQETGGPAVAAPARRGFGSRLIEDALKHELGGARFEFATEGLTCTLTVPGIPS